MVAKAILTQQLLAGESNLYTATSLLKLIYQLTADVACLQKQLAAFVPSMAQHHNISIAVDLP